MRRFSTLLVAALLCVLSFPAQAGRLLDLSVVDRDTGEVLRTYRHGGELWVAGTPGHRYAVRLSNRSSGRVLAVLSVDGVNAVSGQTAATDQTGYVLAARQSSDIAGWRKNLDEIAQFTFTALSDSYASRTGRPDNVGVIGVAVFPERAPEPPVISYRESAQAAESAAPPPPPAAAGAPTQKASAADGMARRTESERLGTGHGAREESRVTETSFERASPQPAEVLSIRYDSRENLIARGIIPRPRHRPEPFPGSFVPDPPRR